MLWFFLAFSSALLSAAAAISQKKVLFQLPALEFSFTLAILNMLISLPILIGIDFSTLSGIGLLVLYGKTILGAFAFWCVMLAIKNLEISGALPLMSLTPGLVALFAFILLGENLTAYEITGMILLLFGTYVIDRKRNNNILEPFKVFVKSQNHRYILFALILFTTSSILDKLILVQYHLTPYQFVCFQHIFLAVNFFILIMIFGKSPKTIFKKIDLSLWKWLFLISVITIGYRYTQIEAIKIAPVALVLTVKRFSVLFAAIIGGRIFNEHHLLQKSIATAIIILGAILILQK
jgi:drug/metabolite transporter (DMT)-like permease